MKILGIIPARYDSTRFPGKPIAIINGKPMIQRVYKQASKSKTLSKVIVATDDIRIVEVVKQIDGEVMITSKDHKSGTERCNEVFEQLKKSNEVFDVIVNIQGDEPYIKPEQIDAVTDCFSNPNVQIATLKKKINTNDELFNPNVNKVIVDQNQEAIYFSRNPIPYLKNIEKDSWLENHDYYKHIGIYAYRSSILEEITKLKSSSLEIAESLEQLRWLENGYRIKVLETIYDSIAVDIPEDLSKFLNMS